MAQPVWQTPAGSLGVIPESVFYQQTMYAYDPDGGDVYYRLIAGTLPEGIQCSVTGLIAGVPLAVASLQGVPTMVWKLWIASLTVLLVSQSPATTFQSLLPQLATWAHFTTVIKLTYRLITPTMIPAM